MTNKSHGKKKFKNCEICNKSFSYYPYSYPNRRFCSNKCMGISYTVDRIGMKFSDEHKKNISISRKGQTSPMKGRKFSEEHKHKLSLSHIGKKLSKEHIKKCLKRNPKSSLELKFENIINKLGYPYRFVGNGDFFIERKCPDFINTNGEKIAIEVYARKHKERFRNGIDDWISNRKQIFNKYGWILEFFDETQVNEIEIINRLGD